MSNRKTGFVRDEYVPTTPPSTPLSLDERNTAKRAVSSATVFPPKNTRFCVYIVFCMPSITVNVDDDLKDRMEQHPEINWSEVTRQAIQEKIKTLDVMAELTSGSQLTESDVAEIANKVNESARDRVEEESE